MGMVEVAEIKDQDSLKAWLLDRPEDESKRFATTIAHRAAMRALPVYWAWVETSGHVRKHDWTALSILRCNLTMELARRAPDRKIISAAFAACNASEFDAASAKTVASEAFAASEASDAIVASDAALSAAKASSTLSTAPDVVTNCILASKLASYAVSEVIWGQIRLDCEGLLNRDMSLTTFLWNGDENPIQEVWDKICEMLGEGNVSLYGRRYGGTQIVGWSFWIKWYQDALEGREPDWDMLEEIALIPNENWEKGPEHINNVVIAGIVDKYAKKKAGTSNPDITTPSGAEKKTISQNVVANREALALSIAGVLEQIKEYRERVRELNSLEPEYKEGLLDFLDRLSKQLSDLLEDLPDEGEVVSEEKSAKLVLWWREYKLIFRGKAKAYLTADNIAEATVPAGIILGCTGIGAIFGPVGATAGGVVGSLITGQIKPGKAAGELMKDLDVPDSGV